MDAVKVGNKIRTLREDRGISRFTLAVEIGVTPQAVQMYESGERTPRDEIKEKIADFFDVTVQEIFFDE